MTEREIFTAARAQTDPSARAALLTEACGSDLSLRQRLDRLLRADAGTDSILDFPVVSPANLNHSDTYTVASNTETAADSGLENEVLAFLEPPRRADSLGRIGHYEVLEVLGRGGFGIVFRACDEVLQRVVAVKVLAPQLAVTAPARKRFLREARTSARIRHDNVVQVYAVEEMPLPYLVMEFIPGETLQQHIDRIGPLELPEVLRIGRQIAHGLASAHATGLIHRDIKPSNVLIENGPHGRVKLTDFGLARAADDASITQNGTVTGTPKYMSPEQALGERLDHRSDLFSLGSVLYVMISGRLPFRAETTLAVLKRVSEDTAVPLADIVPATPNWLSEIIARLHAKDPSERIQSAQEVADLLVPDAENGGKTRLSCRRRRFSLRSRWAAAAVVILLLLGGLGMTEATGLTELHPSIMHLFTTATTLVKADDPGPPPPLRTDAGPKGDGSIGAGPKKIKTVAPPPDPNFALRFAEPGPSIVIPSLLLPASGPLTVEGYVTLLGPVPAGRGIYLMGAPYQFNLELMFKRIILFGKGPPAVGVKYITVASLFDALPDKKYHVAGVRTSEEFLLFIDGRRVGIGPAFFGSGSVFRIGEKIAADFDEIRVSRTARYSQDFQPRPRFEPDADTLALVDFAPGPGTANLTSAGGTDIFLAQLPGVIVNDTGGSTTVVEGGATDTYTVVLDWLPTANVIVTLSPDAQVSLSATTLTFTPANHNVLQTVTVTAVDDTSSEGSHTGVITHTASSTDLRFNGLTGSLTANIADNDQQPLQLYQTYNQSGDYVAAGVGVNGGTSGTINLGGIPAGSTITAAYLYWGFYDLTQNPAQPNLTFAGTPITGTLIGSQIFGAPTNNYVYRATVTSLVAGNGAYSLTGIASGAPTNCNGASLVVIYANPILPTRTILIYDGNNVVNPPFLSVANTFSGFTAPARLNAKTTFIVGDGGNALSETASFTGSLGTLPLNNTFDGSSGLYWDTDTYNVTSYLAGGDTSVSANASFAGDQVYWLAQVLSIGPTSVILTPTAGSTDVAEAGATDTYTVRLGTVPTADVVITLNPGSQLTLSATTLTFTTLTWDIPQTLTVTAINDGLVEGPHTGTISHTATSADPNYSGITIADVTANITDGPGVVITPTAGSTAVTEGGATDTYTVVLNSLPTASVTVTLSAASQATLSAATLVFTTLNWSTTQTVTLTAIDDAFNEGPHTGVISHTASSTDPNYAGISIASVTANITDNDIPGVTITPSGGSTNLTEGGTTDTYTLVLTTMPTANVVVTVTPNSQVTASPATLTFLPAAWNVAQTVTVTAVDDFRAEGIHSGTLTHTSSSGDPNYNALVIASVTAAITDNETAGVSIASSGGSTNLTEGGAADTYTVVLTSQPTANVVVTLNPNAQVTVTASTLNFTTLNWNVAQTVTVTAVDDAVFEGPHTGLVVHTASSADASYSGLSLSALTANITDNDAPGLAFNPVALGLSEGGPTGSYAIALTSQPTANVVVALNPGTQLTLASAAALTFTPVNWNVPRTLTVTAIDDLLAEGLHNGTIAHTATSTDPSYNLAANWTVSITDNDVPGVTLSATSLTMLEGASRTYTAVLTLPPLADIVVTLNPGPQLSVAPATLTFTPGNWNVTQVVTVAAFDDMLVQGNHADTVTHSATSADLTYNGLAITPVTANILDNEGLVIAGTAGPDRVVITNSTDLTTINVNLNGKISSYSSTLTQLVISTSGGADDIQIYNPRVPIVVIGGQHNDKVLIAGQTGNNTFTLDDAALTVNSMLVSLFEVENVLAAGNSGDDTFAVLNTPVFTVECRGNQGSDVLQGSDRANTWKVINPDIGTLNTNIKFTAVENLQGGSSTDGLFLNSAKKISGTFDGGAGTNELNYGLYSTPVSVNLQTGLATGMASFQNVARVIGGKSSGDKLVGLDQTNLWNIINLNSGDVNGVVFQNIENLVGGQQDDTFRLGDNRGLKGKIDGGAGANVLDYGSYLSRAIAINLQLHTATNLAGFLNIAQVLGGAGLDTLIGANLVNVWNVTASNAGDVNGLAFTGFENLTGGIKNDSFNLSGGVWTGLLNGGTGSDTLTSGGGAYTITGVGAGLLNGRKFLGIEYRI